jgi:hypothetical protein
MNEVRTCSLTNSYVEFGGTIDSSAESAAADREAFDSIVHVFDILSHFSRGAGKHDRGNFGDFVVFLINGDFSR